MAETPHRRPSKNIAPIPSTTANQRVTARQMTVASTSVSKSPPPRTSRAITQIDGGGGKPEGQEGETGGEQLGAIAELVGDEQGQEEQEVLGPLMDAQGARHRAAAQTGRWARASLT